MPEQNKAIVRRLIEEIDKKNFEVFDELCAPHLAYHFPGRSEPMSREEEKESVQSVYAAFPDLYHTVEDQIAEGDKVVTRITDRGTHTGEFQGVPATGKEVAFSVIDICRVVDGQIVEEWAQGDFVGLVRQLGVLPSIGKDEK